MTRQNLYQILNEIRARNGREEVTNKINEEITNVEEIALDDEIEEE